MDRVAIRDRTKLKNKLPAFICSEPKIPCGRRHKNRSCRCSACAYAIKTVDLQTPELKFFLAYIRS